jgi:S-adenosylmethionine:tRNA ribosyltransferase-isomerase
LVDFIPTGSVLVFNQSPVFPARFRARKETGGELEGLFLEASKDSSRVWLQGRVSSGEWILLADDLKVQVIERLDREALLKISAQDFRSFLEQKGLPGLPPYIRKLRKKQWGSEEWGEDRERYQSLLAQADAQGFSVAAPTASLHFDRELLSALENQGVSWESLELDVGEGTFAPLTESHFAEDRLHVEKVRLSSSCFERLSAAKKSGAKIIAVGTTSLRAMESAALRVKAGLPLGSFETDLFIHPQKSFEFLMADALFTNFHQPESSLIMLIARFLEPEAETIQHRWRALYEEAVRENYRLFSYGDAMLIL